MKRVLSKCAYPVRGAATGSILLIYLFVSSIFVANLQAQAMGNTGHENSAGSEPAQKSKSWKIGIIPNRQSGKKNPIGYGVTGGNQIGYNGGPVMLGPHNVYLIWYGNWSNNTATTILPQFVSALNRSLYFNTNISYAQLIIDQSGTGHILSEANIANTVTLAGQTFDSYSQGTSLSVSQVYNVVARALSSGLASDGNGIYFVLTSSDVNGTSGSQSFCSNFCGYHTYGTFHNSALLKFAFVGNPDRCPSSCETFNLGIGPNGNAGADGMANVMAHELNETVTDPLLNAWFSGSTQGEVGDLCNFNFGSEFTAPNGAPANVVLGGRYFLIQQNWVNSGGGFCGLSYGANGTQASGTVAFTGSIPCDSGACDEGTIQLTVNTTTETLTYDGSGFYGAGSVQAIAQGFANAFNSDPNSPVTAVAFQGSILPAGDGDNWQIVLTSKQVGSATNYGVSSSINSFFSGSSMSSLAITNNYVLTGGTDSCCN